MSLTITNKNSIIQLLQRPIQENGKFPIENHQEEKSPSSETSESPNRKFICRLFASNRRFQEPSLVRTYTLKEYPYSDVPRRIFDRMANRLVKGIYKGDLNEIESAITILNEAEVDLNRITGPDQKNLLDLLRDIVNKKEFDMWLVSNRRVDSKCHAERMFDILVKAGVENNTGTTFEDFIGWTSLNQEYVPEISPRGASIHSINRRIIDKAIKDLISGIKLCNSKKINSALERLEDFNINLNHITGPDQKNLLDLLRDVVNKNESGKWLISNRNVGGKSLAERIFDIFVKAGVENNTGKTFRDFMGRPSLNQEYVPEISPRGASMDNVPQHMIDKAVEDLISGIKLCKLEEIKSAVERLKNYKLDLNRITGPDQKNMIHALWDAVRKDDSSQGWLMSNRMMGSKCPAEEVFDLFISSGVINNTGKTFQDIVQEIGFNYAWRVSQEETSELVGAMDNYINV